MYTCLLLANSDDAKVFESKPVTVKSELVGLFVTYPFDAFETLLKEIENGSLSLSVGSKTYRIYLNRVAAGLKSQSVSAPKLSFSSIWKPGREYEPDPNGYRPSIVLQTLGDRFYELLSPDDNERISKRLRAHKPRYNGLDGLLQFVGTRHRPNSSSDQALVEIKAVFPFKTTIQEDQIFVDSPKSVAPKVSTLFFFSGHESMTVRCSKQFPIADQPNFVSVPFHIEWPSNVSQAEAHVLYDKKEVETVSIRHWASRANWRVAVDSYFDSEARLLKEALRGDSQRLKGEKRSEAFEQAIVRVLTLAGMAVTWHGDIRQSGRPDLAGYCEVPGRRIALIGECTLEKPSVKLSTLKSRLSEVLQLVGDSAEVLPVVFTACDPIQSDYDSAATEGIALVGRSQIGWILELVERNSGVSEIIKQIENTRTINSFPNIARWEERYT